VIQSASALDITAPKDILAKIRKEYAMFRLVLPVVSILALSTASASSHELWIEPLAWTIPANGIVAANLVNGERFGGNRVSYLPKMIEAFDLYIGTLTSPVESRIGNTPALSMKSPQEGLMVVAYHSTPSRLVYDNWEKFEKFTIHKDLGDAAEMQAARGLTQEKVTEIYTRFSKSLIGIGAAQGSDLNIGLETEIVALANPYTDDLSGGFPVQLFYQGAVRADARIEVFARGPDGVVSDTYVRTDAEGLVTVPVVAGHDYMLDAVVLREPSAELAAAQDVMWESLWANLTFHVPK
jgi:hypothetical protein